MAHLPDSQSSVWSLRHAARDPLSFLADLARSPDDIVRFSLGRRPAFLLRHPEDIEAVLVTHHHKFVKAYGLQRARRLLGNGLLTSEGEEHRRQRAAIQPGFHRPHLEQYAAIMVAQTARVRDSWRESVPIDVSSETSALTLAIVTQSLFGTDVGSLSSDVRRALQLATDTIDPLVSLLAPARRVRPQRQRLLEIVDGLIAQRRAAGRGGANLISLLLEHEAGPQGEITDQLRDDLLTLLLAGHETIANALVWTWILLAQDRGLQSRLEEEVDAVLDGRPATAADVTALGYTRRVLAESLRLLPPAWVVARTAAMEHRLSDVRIPAGAIVLISQYLLHRDARFFSDPHRFDPDRWLSNHPDRPRSAFIPFGAGPRACIGEGFAWMEGVLLLATIAQRWRLEAGDDARSIELRPQITLRPSVRVRMVPRARATRQ